MKIVIAIDSYKGSLSSLQAGEAARRGVLRACPEAEVTELPLADGGEGTMDTLVAALGGHICKKMVQGPLQRKVEAKYGLAEGDTLAVIEMAQAAGLPLLRPEERNPLQATTYGLGELIAAAYGQGARHFLIGIGGSATNDAGAGMLQALGVQLMDSQGRQLPWGGAALADLASIEEGPLLPRLRQECQFEIACDVENPLCGSQGASMVYGPQKGASPAEVAVLEKALSHFADGTARYLSKDLRQQPGSGAAGGLGFAFTAFLDGRLRRGVELVLDVLHMQEVLAKADVVLTGEGRMDGQTAMGKAPAGVAARAGEHAVVVGLAGCLGQGIEACHGAGIHACFAIPEGPLTLEEAMAPERAAQNLARQAEEVVRLICAVKENR